MPLCRRMHGRRRCSFASMPEKSETCPRRSVSSTIPSRAPSKSRPMPTTSPPRKVTIVRASNAFIYLPLYLAEDKNLFAQVQRPHDPRAPLKYEFLESRRSQYVGEGQSLKEIRVLTTKNLIAFVFADPLHISNMGP